MNCSMMFWLFAGSPAHVLNTASFMLNMPAIQLGLQDALAPDIAEKSAALQPGMGAL